MKTLVVICAAALSLGGCAKDLEIKNISWSASSYSPPPQKSRDQKLTYSGQHQGEKLEIYKCDGLEGSKNILKKIRNTEGELVSVKGYVWPNINTLLKLRLQSMQKHRASITSKLERKLGPTIELKSDKSWKLELVSGQSELTPVWVYSGIDKRLGKVQKIVVSQEGRVVENKIEELCGFSAEGTALEIESRTVNIDGRLRLD